MQLPAPRQPGDPRQALQAHQPHHARHHLHHHPHPRTPHHPPPRWRLLALLPLLLASACGTLPPTAPMPASEAVVVPAGWSATDAAGGMAVTAADLTDWWRRFDDAELVDWAQRALQHNTRVVAAQAGLRLAQAQRDAAAATLSPTLGGQASAGRGTSGLGSDGSGSNRWQLGLDASWAPDLAGAGRAALDAADATLRARAASLGDVQVQVAAEVALAHVGLRAQQVRLALAGDTLASQRQTLQITDWRQQAGLVSVLDVEQARAAVAQTEALLPALQTAITQGRHALAVLAGQPPATATPVAASAVPTVPVAPEGLAMDIPAQTLRQRADVRAAEHDVAAALSRVGQAQAQRWPSFAIGGSLGLSALTLGGLGRGAAVVSNLLASVSLPLFDGGARQAQVQVQQALLDQARQTHRAAVLAALQQVEDALAALQGDRLRLASLRTAAQAATRAAELARLRFSSGLVDFQTVLQTQRTRFSAEDAVVATTADLARDHIQLFKALGGGWRAAPAVALHGPSP